MRVSPTRFLSIFYRAGNATRRWRWVAVALARGTGSEAVHLRIEHGEGSPIDADWGRQPGVYHRGAAGDVLYRFEQPKGGCCEVRKHSDAGSSLAADPLRSVALCFQRRDQLCRLILWRRDSAGALHRAELEEFASLLPHAVRAVRLGASIDQAKARQTIVAEALARVRRGVALVTPNGRIVYRDQWAQAWLSQANAPFRDKSGQLRADDAAVQTSLDTILQACVCQVVSGSQPAVAVRILEDMDGGVAIQPVRKPTADRGTLVSIRPCRAEGQQRSPEPALRAEGLTPREAALACALASGLSISEFALREGLSRSTVRTHLRSLFGKLHVNRQAEVVTHVRALSV